MKNNMINRKQLYTVLATLGLLSILISCGSIEGTTMSPSQSASPTPSVFSESVISSSIQSPLPSSDNDCPYGYFEYNGKYYLNVNATFRDIESGYIYTVEFKSIQEMQDRIRSGDFNGTEVWNMEAWLARSLTINDVTQPVVRVFNLDILGEITFPDGSTEIEKIIWQNEMSFYSKTGQKVVVGKGELSLCFGLTKIDVKTENYIDEKNFMDISVYPEGTIETTIDDHTALLTPNQVYVLKSEIDGQTFYGTLVYDAHNSVWQGQFAAEYPSTAVHVYCSGTSAEMCLKQLSNFKITPYNAV